MAEVTNGQKICSTCGVECTKLYGFVMQVRKDLMLDQGVKDEYDRVMKKYGQADFLFCWDCTAKAFGIKTLKEKEAESAKDAFGGQKITEALHRAISESKDGDFIAVDEQSDGTVSLAGENEKEAKGDMKFRDVDIKNIPVLHEPDEVVDLNAETTLEVATKDIEDENKSLEVENESLKKENADAEKGKQEKTKKQTPGKL